MGLKHLLVLGKYACLTPGFELLLHGTQLEQEVTTLAGHEKLRDNQSEAHASAASATAFPAGLDSPRN